MNPELLIVAVCSVASFGIGLLCGAVIGLTAREKDDE